jgi:restriction endonuclease S subunit
MPEQKKMTVFTAKKDTPYIVDDELAQLLLDSRPEPEQQDIVTECARVFETMNIRTAKRELADEES